jgi:hypothetical protein
MLSPISLNTPATAVADLSASTSQKTAAPTPVSSQSSSPTTAPAAQSAPSVDTVKISSAGQQALQESRETPAQTTKEASRGDLQAKHLLAKLATEKASRTA